MVLSLVVFLIPFSNQKQLCQSNFTSMLFQVSLPKQQPKKNNPITMNKFFFLRELTACRAYTADTNRTTIKLENRTLKAKSEV